MIPSSRLATRDSANAAVAALPAEGSTCCHPLPHHAALVSPSACGSSPMLEREATGYCAVHAPLPRRPPSDSILVWLRMATVPWAKQVSRVSSARAIISGGFVVAAKARYPTEAPSSVPMGLAMSSRVRAMLRAIRLIRLLTCHQRYRTKTNLSRGFPPLSVPRCGPHLDDFDIAAGDRQHHIGNPIESVVFTPFRGHCMTVPWHDTAGASEWL